MCYWEPMRARPLSRLGSAHGVRSWDIFRTLFSLSFAGDRVRRPDILNTAQAGFNQNRQEMFF
jgi:hypothetical protein